MPAKDTDLIGVVAPRIIRTETVLSRLPVHLLSKKGRVGIRVVKFGDRGDLLLRWEVSNNERYGPPRQLAYKLDTLIVNRRIDQAPRPLPTVIRLGSLKEICRELGFADSGKNTRDVRQAMLQNSSVFINADLSYRAANGTQQRIEAGFTRYGVVFTGENLPEGRKADAVHVVLNQPYWKVVSTAPVRPLNYDYMKELTPASQRFYEIVSYRIFGAMKGGRGEARILYSDYCAFAGQQRHLSPDHFRVQMYKVHKPHLDSGYLKSASVQPTANAGGQPDWMMTYTPGPKAKAEHVLFSAKQNGPSPEQRRSDHALLERLMQRGIAQSSARRLLREVSIDDRLEDLLEWGDYLIQQAPPGKFRNPPGFLVALIRDGIAPPPGFETSRKKTMREQAERAREEEFQARQRLEFLYEDYVSREVELLLRSSDALELEKVVAAKRKSYHRQFPLLPGSTLEQIAWQSVRTEAKSRLNLLSRDEFQAEQNSGLEF